MIKPEHFTTKGKHLIDGGKEYVGVYLTDPTPFLTGVVTGHKVDHPKLGTLSTAQMPSGLSAYILENGITANCEIIVFNWTGMKHYPAPNHYFRDHILPNSRPVK